jgi:hypothetical protein
MEKKMKQYPDNNNAKLGTYSRYKLLFPHLLYDTHQLVEHTNIEQGDGKHLLVPLIIGLTIPRIISPTYKIFVLGHFKPFHNDTPLILPHETVDSVYSLYKFTVAEQKIINNWEEIHECKDER